MHENEFENSRAESGEFDGEEDSCTCVRCLPKERPGTLRAPGGAPGNRSTYIILHVSTPGQNSLSHNLIYTASNLTIVLYSRPDHQLFRQVM